MKKKKYDIIQVLDPDDITDLTVAQKDYYLSLGYQPCMLSSGKIKWLNHSQQVSAIVKPSSKHRFIPNKKNNITSKTRRRRRHKSIVATFLMENWFFISLLILIGLSIFLVTRFLHLTI